MAATKAGQSTTKTSYTKPPLVKALEPFTVDESMSARQVSGLIVLATASRADCTVRGVASILNISKPAVTRMADALARFGWLRREEDKEDRRSVFLVLTADGKKHARDLVKLAGGNTQLAVPSA